METDARGYLDQFIKSTYPIFINYLFSGTINGGRVIWWNDKWGTCDLGGTINGGRVIWVER